MGWMDLLNLFAEYGAWSWIVGGLVLLAIELIAPGGVFVWLGVASIVTGLFTMFNPLPMPFQFALFGALSILALLGWIKVRRRAPKETDAPFLNRRAERHVGREGFLSEPIVGETGRMEIGDTVWRVTGPELPVGHRVRVVGARGALLEVVSAEDDRVESA